jgi:hypothetical protein
VPSRTDALRGCGKFCSPPGSTFDKNYLSALEIFFNLLRGNRLPEVHKKLFKLGQIDMRSWLSSVDTALSHKVFHSLCGDRGEVRKTLTA